MLMLFHRYRLYHNAYKYYYRAGNKAGESAEKDRRKAFWYMQYYVKIARGDKVDINKNQDWAAYKKEFSENNSDSGTAYGGTVGAV